MLRFTLDQVRAMSLAEIHLAIDGFVEMQKAQAGVRGDDEAPTLDEVYELIAQIEG